MTEIIFKNRKGKKRENEREGSRERERKKKMENRNDLVIKDSQLLRDSLCKLSNVDVSYSNILMLHYRV